MKIEHIINHHLKLNYYIDKFKYYKIIDNKQKTIDALDKILETNEELDMRVIKYGTIVDIIKTYNLHTLRINNAKKQYDYYEAFDDTDGMKKMQELIDKEEQELGKFLDLEV